MFSHITIGVIDLGKAASFYDAFADPTRSCAATGDTGQRVAVLVLASGRYSPSSLLRVYSLRWAAMLKRQRQHGCLSGTLNRSCRTVLC